MCREHAAPSDRVVDAAQRAERAAPARRPGLPLAGAHRARRAAVLVLMVSGVTDYLDGKIARRWDQTSRLGPAAGPGGRPALHPGHAHRPHGARRGAAVADASLLVGRDVLLASTLPVLRRHGYGPLPVHFLGKAATFNLLCGFPLLLLGEWDERWSATSRTRSAGRFAIWGTALYWWAGVLYLVQVRRSLARDRGPVSDAACQGGGRREGGRDGRGRGHPPAPDDRQHAQAAAPDRQQADHGARPAAARAARLLRDRRHRAVPRQPGAQLLRRRRGARA